MGDAVGHWEGETLVVETTNFLPREVDAPDQDPAADMKVVERFTRLPVRRVLYAYAVTNPARYTQTWQAEMVLHRPRGRSTNSPATRATTRLANMLAGARRLEGKTVDGVAAGR